MILRYFQALVYLFFLFSSLGKCDEQKTNAEKLSDKKMNPSEVLRTSGSGTSEDKNFLGNYVGDSDNQPCFFRMESSWVFLYKNEKKYQFSAQSMTPAPKHELDFDRHFSWARVTFFATNTEGFLRQISGAPMSLFGLGFVEGSVTVKYDQNMNPLSYDLESYPAPLSFLANDFSFFKTNISCKNIKKE